MIEDLKDKEYSEEQNPNIIFFSDTTYKERLNNYPDCQEIYEFLKYRNFVEEYSPVGHLDF